MNLKDYNDGTHIQSDLKRSSLDEVFYFFFKINFEFYIYYRKYLGFEFEKLQHFFEHSPFLRKERK